MLNISSRGQNHQCPVFAIGLRLPQIYKKLFSESISTLTFLPFSFHENTVSSKDILLEGAGAQVNNIGIRKLSIGVGLVAFFWILNIRRIILAVHYWCLTCILLDLFFNPLTTKVNSWDLYDGNFGC